jgi:ATP-dependent protease Clp ATPase subunit
VGIDIKCIFCKRAKNEAGLLLSFLEGNICAYCIEQASKIIHSYQKKKSMALFSSYWGVPKS